MKRVLVGTAIVLVVGVLGYLVMARPGTLRSEPAGSAGPNTGSSRPLPQPAGEANNTEEPRDRPAAEVLLPPPPPPPTLDEGATRSSPSLNQRLDDELQQAWKELTEGRIAYEPSRTMTEGEPEDVRVRIARGETIDTESGFGGRRVLVERLKASFVMTASLSADAGDFEIVPLSSEGQALVDPFTDWIWRVTPLRSGDLALNVRVTARIRLSNGSSEDRDLLVQAAQISVRANPRWRATKFWERNWQWILGSPILGGVLTWLAARLLRRRRAGNPIDLKHDSDV